MGVIKGGRRFSWFRNCRRAGSEAERKQNEKIASKPGDYELAYAHEAASFSYGASRDFSSGGT
jgi:hypothetical protein